MENTQSSVIPEKRKHGRPLKYANPREKTQVNQDQRRMKRQVEAATKRDLAHANFYNSISHQEPGENARSLIDPHFLANPIGEPSTDVSEFLPPASPPPLDDTEEQAILDAGIPLDAVDSASEPDHASLEPNNTFDTSLEFPPAVENEARDEDQVASLADELAEQLIKFQGCCNNCHQTAEHGRMEDPHEYLSLAMYLEFTPALGPDILGLATLARQEDNLAGRMDSVARREVFCSIGSRGEIPHIGLSQDDRVTDEAGVSFDVDSIIAFPSCLSAAKQGIKWSPTQMPVSDLQSDLHLRSRPVTYFDASGRQHHVHRSVHQIPHYTFGRVFGFEDISVYFLFPNLYREEQKCSRLLSQDEARGRHNNCVVR